MDIVRTKVLKANERNHDVNPGLFNTVEKSGSRNGMQDISNISVMKTFYTCIIVGMSRTEIKV